MKLIRELSSKNQAIEKELEELQQKSVDMENSLQVETQEITEILTIKEEDLANLKREVEERNEKEKNSSKRKFLDFLNDSIDSHTKNLECPVCFETAEPPIYQCNNEHLICNNCRKNVNDQCPECRQPYNGEYKRARYAEKMVEDKQRFEQQRMHVLENIHEELESR